MSRKRERSSPDSEVKLQQPSNGSLLDKHHRPTSHVDRVGDETRRPHHQFPNDNERSDKHQRKMAHSSSSVDDSKRKHSRQSRDNFDRDKSTRDYSGRLRDDSNRDRTKSKHRQSADSDGGNSSDGQNSRSKHRSKDLHRRRSSEAEKETAESVCQTRRRRSSSGDEQTDNSRGKVAGYGLIVSWQLFVL